MKQEFTVHLRPEDVHLGLPASARPPLELVAVSLERLGRWGNLRADPDTSRVTALEDFYRARHSYQLTRAGEAAEEALAAYDDALGRRGELQAVALADIAVQLRALVALTDRDEPDPAAAYLSLLALVERFSGLADNARAFMGSLQRTVDLHEAEVEVFLAYKERLIDYLERFIEDLVTRGAEIAGLLEDLGAPPEGRVAALLAGAAARDAADAAPDVAEAARAAALERWHGRWDGLRAWFLSVPGRSSQAKLLRSAARQAVPQLPGDGSWIALDGRFRLGSLVGAWGKAAAEYLGEGAREQARRARIETLTAELAELDAATRRLADSSLAGKRPRLP